MSLEVSWAGGPAASAVATRTGAPADPVVDPVADPDARLGWLRAALLGATDGTVSVAGLVVGVAGATPHRGAVLAAGVAGLVAGSASMALGEWVSVAAQRDGQRARRTDGPLASPGRAAAASAASFVLGALLPLLAVLGSPAGARVPVTAAAVLLALAGAGVASARLAGSRVRPAVVRVVLGGALALVVTHEAGCLCGALLS